MFWTFFCQCARAGSVSEHFNYLCACLPPSPPYPTLYDQRGWFGVVADGCCGVFAYVHVSDSAPRTITLD